MLVRRKGPRAARKTQDGENGNSNLWPFLADVRVSIVWAR
jgi:hypothetical protein